MSWSKRTLLDSLLLISILFLPWWVGVVLMIWFFWKYDLPEVIFFALLMDILYASLPATKAIHFPYFWGMDLAVPQMPILTFTLGCAILMIILNLVKKRIRFNE